MTQFIQHLIEVHVNDLAPVQPPQVIPGTYYLPNGVAYYFSPTGEQLRKLPKSKLLKPAKHLILMTTHLWINSAQRITLEYHMVVMVTYLCTFVQFMAIHMGSIL